LLRRAHAPWHGRWCAPSGFCDGPEHPIDTAERETLEEAGLEIRVVGYLGTWISPYADDGVETDEYVSVQYYAATPVGEPTLEPNPAEVSETGWFDPADPPLGLGPDRVLRAALTALRTALTAGAVRTPLPDRPRRAS
jgi:ADP-ribose pyrophosphatase YjhB (NUDIX family)